MIWQAVWAGFGYFQREAGYTRTGSHYARVNGRETGQWHEADLAVAHWLQHPSRDGDMQLHVHSQIAHTPTIPIPDLADLVSLAQERSAKMVLAGDTNPVTSARRSSPSSGEVNPGAVPRGR